ncbi:MAG: hypothetical protein QM772_11820 [Ottowia sp.]|uniref:hypothetical protein n=1 Tax=Ottowia sp. TaxID=1898956 RepID=UPI0039E65DBD
MASSLIPDPFQMWRDALTKMEGEVNTLATGSLKSNEVVRTMNQLAGMTLGTQQMFEKVMEAYLRRANLPSRKEVAELAESLQRIESKLDQVLGVSAAAPAAAPRPARTRRPAAAPAPEAAPEPEAVKAPKKTAKKTAARGRKG